MAFSRRSVALFTSGILLGAAAAAWWVWAPRAAADVPPDTVGALSPTAVLGAGPAPQLRCDFAPLLPAAGGKDGRERLAAEGADLSAEQIARLLVSGKESAAGGRRRDAEVIFRNACRAAERRPSDAGTLADARYQLARHYLALVRAQAVPSKQHPALLERAGKLYDDSLRHYLEQRGPRHEKTRFASNGLARVRQIQAGGPATGALLAQDEDAGAAADEELARQEMQRGTGGAERRRADAGTAPAPTAAPARKKAPQAAAARSSAAEASARPSFDCAKARSEPEKLICADAELARLDRELGRLHAKAEAAAEDRRDFKRRSDREWLDREARCRDRDCLLDWYAQRQEQLQAQLAAN